MFIYIYNSKQNYIFQIQGKHAKQQQTEEKKTGWFFIVKSNRQ